MDELIVQPMGGAAGMGVGHMVSEGRMKMSALSPEDRTRVESLFARPEAGPSNFYYRLTRTGQDVSKSINVAAGDVPQALIASIETTLR